MKIEYIRNVDQLEDLCQRIEHSSWIAIDTEFLREKTYYPKFCLLQLATPAWVACVDPLLLPSLERLFTAIYNPSVIKVFHSCRQDLEIFYQLTNKIPTPIFDTQMAAPLLGYQDHIGYGALVLSLLNKTLHKAHTRADWSHRPLSADEIQYAADDVIYLCAIYQKIVEQLTQFGRLEWLKDDFLSLENPALYQTVPEEAWLKVKGKNKLTGRQLAIIKVVAHWREATAQIENKPKNWLLKDDVLFDLAKLQPETLESLTKIRDISDKVVQQYGQILCELVRNAKKSPAPVLPSPSKIIGHKEPQLEAVIDILFALVRVRAEENSLNPTVLATRGDLENLILDNDESCLLLRGWRFAMVGQELQQLLRGELLIKIEKKFGKIVLNLSPTVQS
jgi:ribonuclease D